MSCRTVLAGVALVFWLAAPPAFAQDTRSDAAAVAKSVVVDPTTYAPGILFYTSTHLDWASSQPFFAHGVTEHNPDFTISGRPDDLAISYGAGNRKIVELALMTAGISAGNNVAEQVVQRFLERRDPAHRKLWRTLGWVERIGFASFLAYERSARHFEQWQVNQQIAAQRGYR